MQWKLNGEIICHLSSNVNVTSAAMSNLSHATSHIVVQQFSKISTDTERRAVPLRQLSLLLSICPAIGLAIASIQHVTDCRPKFSLSLCVCHVCAHSHGRISWSIFAKSSTEVTTPKVRSSSFAPLLLFCLQKNVTLGQKKVR